MLMIAGTVCSVVLGGTVTVLIVELIHPETDTSVGVAQIGDVLNTLIGLLAGFLAGRTDMNAQERHRLEEEARRAREANR